MKILAVDDSPSILAVIRYIIHHEGWELAEAENEPEAIKLFEQHKDFDLVIVDHGSQKVNGLQVLEHLRDSGYKGKSIVLSLDAREKFIEEIKGLGISGWLHKPFSNEHFCQAVNHAMGHELFNKKSA